MSTTLIASSTATPALGAVPSGQSAPLEILDAQHHGAWVTITTAIGLTLGLVCLFIRTYVRVMISPPFLRDDIIQAASTAFAIIQSAVVFFEVSKGFGTSHELVSARDLRTVQQAWAASDILYLVGIYLSKCSMAFLFLRLTPSKIHNKIAWGTIGLCTVWVIVSIFLVIVNCEVRYPWADIAGQCSNMFARWQFITAIDIMTEILLVGLAVFLVHDLRMSVGRKGVVVIAFLFRLPLIAFAALHLHFLAHGISSLNPSLDLVGPVIWAQIELHYSNIAATVPCLKPFMAAVSTNYGATEPAAMSQGGSRGYGSSGAKRKGSNYMLSSINKDRNSSNIDSKGGIFRVGKRGAYKMNSETFGASQSTNGHVIVQQGKAKQDSNSIGSNDSRKMIIKKEVNIRVERDGGSQPDEEMGIESVGAGRAI